MDRMVKRRRIAVVPARGGSKRLPQKNIMNFFGKPMIAWTIEAAIEAKLFDRIIVSTEDNDIARIGSEYGADVPFRRELYFDDDAPVSAATIHAITQAKLHLGEEYEEVCQLMPNCPLRNADDVRVAHTAFETRRADFQISCTSFGWPNPWWALTLDGDGNGERLFPSAIERRSQDLPRLFCPTGAIWIARVPKLMSSGSFYGPEHRFEPMSWISAVDIDDQEDLIFARAAYMVRNNLEKSGRP